MNQNKDYRSYVISRSDAEIGLLIDNCLSFLYSVNLDEESLITIHKIEAKLYEMVYMGRSKEATSRKEHLFKDNIMPIMRKITPQGCYFGTHPENSSLLGFWEQ